MFKTVNALVLREVRYKEADRILTLLTDTDGKITVKARGALRKSSKTAAATQQLTYSEMTLFGNLGRWTVNEATVKEGFDGLRADIGAVRREAEAGFAGLRAGQVRGHDDDGVFEADRAAKAVGQDAVAEQLQQDACHVAVGLFQLIEEQDAVGAAADLLRERAARVVADVARRRAEQARDARRLHILRHIHPDERDRAAVDDLRELIT